MRYGFQAEEKWYQCGGEVFRIYAKGKREGWRVKEGDDVMFYYVEQPGRWVSQVTTQRTRKRTCSVPFQVRQMQGRSLQDMDEVNRLRTS